MAADSPVKLNNPPFTTSNAVLSYAWQQFLNYDEDSNKEKKRHHRVRAWIIGLGVLISIGAILSNFIQTETAKVFLTTSAPFFLEVSIGFLIVLCSMLVLMLLLMFVRPVFHFIYYKRILMRFFFIGSCILGAISLFVWRRGSTNIGREPLISGAPTLEVAVANASLLGAIFGLLFTIIFAPLIFYLLKPPEKKAASSESKRGNEPGNKQPENSQPPARGATGTLNSPSSALTTGKQADSDIKQSEKEKNRPMLWAFWFLVTLAGFTTIYVLLYHFDLLYWEMKHGFVVNTTEIVRVLLIISPVLLAGLMAYAAQFMPVLAWVMHRVAAEDIRRNIYLYRMKAGIYSDLSSEQTIATDGEIRPEASEAALPNQNLPNDGSSDTANPYYKEEDEYAKNITHEVRLQRAVSNVAKRMLKANVITKSLDIPPVPEEVQKALADYKIFKDSPADTGFNTMSVDDYIVWRLRNQMEWYIKKYNEDARNLRAWRVIILFVTGLSSALAALRLELYVAVTTALVSAFTLWMSLKMHGQTYTRYYHTHILLGDRLAKWKASRKYDEKTPVDLKAQSDFIFDVENIMDWERDEWRKQAIILQTSVEQTLLKDTQAPTQSKTSTTS
jgi:hypothetical protein